MGVPFRLRGIASVGIRSVPSGCSQADRLGLKKASLLRYLGGALYRVDRYEDAAKSYQRALSLSPQDREIKQHYGMSLLEGGKVKEAGLVFDELVTHGYRTSSLYYQMSRVKVASGDPTGAVRDLEKALELDPQHANAKALLKKLR